MAIQSNKFSTLRPPVAAHQVNRRSTLRVPQPTTATASHQTLRISTLAKASGMGRYGTLRIPQNSNSEQAEKLNDLAVRHLEIDKKDPKIAVALFEEAEKIGSIAATYNLGLCHANGWGVEQNKEKGIQKIREAANQGLATAKVTLALHLKRLGGSGNEKTAFDLLVKAARDGDVEASCYVGWCMVQGRGTQKDEKGGLQLIKDLVDKKFPLAQCMLGVCRLEGGNEIAAFNLFQEAAKQEHPAAQLRAGMMLMKGIGIGVNEQKAVQFFKAAADQEDPEALHMLAICYLRGAGCPKDEAQALELLRKAADQEFADSLYQLGVCYESGRGTPKDPVKAREFFQRSADQGFEKAHDKLKSLPLPS